MAKKKEKEESSVAGKETAAPKIDESWELDSAVDTLLRAEEIKNDPEKMKKIMSRIDKKHKAITSLADLKEKRAELVKEDE